MTRASQAVGYYSAFPKHIIDEKLRVMGISQEEFYDEYQGTVYMNASNISGSVDTCGGYSVSRGTLRALVESMRNDPRVLKTEWILNMCTINSAYDDRSLDFLVRQIIRARGHHVPYAFIPGSVDMWQLDLLKDGFDENNNI